jgi:hypothetical protein
LEQVVTEESRIELPKGKSFEKVTHDITRAAEECFEDAPTIAGFLYFMSKTQPRGDLADEEGASYKSISAACHNAGLNTSERVAIYRTLEQTSCRQTHIGTVFGSLKNGMTLDDSIEDLRKHLERAMEEVLEEEEISDWGAMMYGDPNMPTFSYDADTDTLAPDEHPYFAYYPCNDVNHCLGAGEHICTNGPGLDGWMYALDGREIYEAGDTTWVDRKGIPCHPDNGVRVFYLLDEDRYLVERTQAGYTDLIYCSDEPDVITFLVCNYTPPEKDRTADLQLRLEGTEYHPACVFVLREGLSFTRAMKIAATEAAWQETDEVDELSLSFDDRERINTWIIRVRGRDAQRRLSTAA